MRRWSGLVLAGTLAVAVTVCVAGPAGAQDDTVVDGVVLSTPYPSVSTEPGSNVKLNLEALAPETEPMTLDVESAPDGWSTVLRGGGFVIGGVTAEPTDPASAQIEIDVPPDAAPGTYHVVLDGIAADGKSTLDLEVDVAEVVDAGIGLTADFPSLRGGPTDTFTYTLTVENNTPTSETFNFAPTAPQGWTVTASPTAESRANTVTIDGGATADVKVTATPPDSVEEGTYPIDVAVTAENGASGSFEVTAEVAGTGTLEMSTASGRLDAGGHPNQETRQTLLVANTGSGAIDGLKFAAAAPDEWEVSFEPATIDSLQPGDTSQVVAVVKPAKDAVAGDYSITMRASAGSASKSVDMRYKVSSSSWLGYFGIAVIVAALGGMVLVFRRLGRR
jgi:uncharacterized membrane protein